VPKRVDLPRRWKRVAAVLLFGVLRLYERLKARLLVGITTPGDAPFYDRPHDLDSYIAGVRPQSRDRQELGSGLMERTLGRETVADLK
jgi:hypothetical protein